MDPDKMDPALAVKGLAVMSAIPVVVFALWGEYFRDYLKKLQISEPRFDRTSELRKVRSVGLFVLIYEVMLFFGSAEIRSSQPNLTYGVFVAAFACYLWIQRGLEHAVSPT